MSRPLLPVSDVDQVIGSDRVYYFQMCQEGTNPPVPYTVFLSTDTIVASIWAGEDQTILASPAGAWVDASVAMLSATVSSANTLALGTPGSYRMQVKVIAAGTTVVAFDGWIKLSSAPGSAANVPVYCSLQDLRDFFPEIEDLLSDTSESGYMKQRGLARTWTDKTIVERENTSAWWSSEVLWWAVDPPSASPQVNPAGGGATGGLLQPGTYYCACTFLSAEGETACGAETMPFTVTAGQIPQVAPPNPFPTGATSANFYLTAPNASPLSETLYATGISPAQAVLNLQAAWLPGKPPLPQSDVSLPIGAFETPNMNLDLRRFQVARARRNALVKSYLDAGGLLFDAVTGDKLREANAKYALSLVLRAQIGPDQSKNGWRELGKEFRAEAEEILSGLQARIDVNGDGNPEIVIPLAEAWCV
jgi:hypothetical protein